MLFRPYIHLRLLENIKETLKRDINNICMFYFNIVILALSIYFPEIIC